LRGRKVAILFDGPNFHHSFVRMGFRLDFEAFEQYCREKYGEIAVKRYYTSGSNIIPPEFVTFLTSIGYEVVVTPNVDTQITVDAVDMIARRAVDAIVIVSSDGGYFPLVEYAYENGARIAIAHDKEFQGFAMLLRGAVKRGLADYINIKDFQREVPLSIAVAPAETVSHAEQMGEEEAVAEGPLSDQEGEEVSES